MLGAYFFNLAFTHNYLTEMILFIFSFFVILVNTGRSIIFIIEQRQSTSETLPLQYMFTQMDTMAKKERCNKQALDRM